MSDVNMDTFTVIYDACVIYPAPLRDFLMRLAISGLFRARWTRHIHDEWMRNVLANRPDLDKGKLQRTRDLMDAHAEGCLVSGYESLIDSLALPDPDDRHGLAAAIVSGADVIVTFNLPDFPAESLREYGIEAQHPDEFITHLLDLSVPAVCAAFQQQRLSLKNPTQTAEQLLNTLERQQLPQTIARLQEFIHLL